MKGRLLDVTLSDPYSNLALEEALFREARVPTLRTWVNQESVVIGRAQLAEFETDLAYCSSRSIPVVRRFTAGGAVYRGPGNLNWSFFVPRGAEDPRLKTSDPGSVFASFARVVAEALGECGAKCDFKPPNSLADGRGKVCGMAAYISKQAVLCHGTLLVSADLKEVQKLTRPGGGRLPRKYPRSRFTRVSNCGVDQGRFVRELALASEYELAPGALTRGETELAAELRASKCCRSEWNLGDPFALDDL